MNQVSQLDDGTVPIREWLETAVMLAGPLPESAIFSDALRQLDEVKQASVAPARPEPVAADSRARERALSRLLLAMFSADELRRLVRYLPNGSEMASALPGTGTPLAGLVDAVVEVGARMGALDHNFFGALEAERPRRREEIEQIRRMFRA